MGQSGGLKGMGGDGKCEIEMRWVEAAQKIGDCTSRSPPGTHE